jgi:DNA repair protein SbcD/Mre11
VVRLLHTADLHLDWPFPSLPASRRTLRRHEIIGVFYQLVTMAIEHQVQAVVIAGDVFGSPAPPLEARSALLTGFARLADHGIPVFLAPGHEEARLKTFEHMELPGNVCLMGGPEANTSNLIPGLTVYGFPAGEERDFRPLQGFRRPDDEPGCHLGVVHGSFQAPSLAYSSERWLPISPEEVAHSNLDYLAMGHYHEHFTSLHGVTHLAYPGSPATLCFGQDPTRSALLVSLGEGPPALERLPLHDRVYLEFRYDLTQIPFHDALKDLEGHAEVNTCARVVFTGVMQEEIDLFAEKVSAKLGGSFFHLEAFDETEFSLPAPGDTIQDLFIRRCQADLAEPNLSPEDKALREYALRAGMVALKGGQL